LEAGTGEADKALLVSIKRVSDGTLYHQAFPKSWPRTFDLWILREERASTAIDVQLARALRRSLDVIERRERAAARTFILNQGHRRSRYRR
jgi:hypothetical protein